MGLMRVGVVRIMHPHSIKPKKATGAIGSGKHASPYKAFPAARKSSLTSHRAPEPPHPIAKAHQPMRTPVYASTPARRATKTSARVPSGRHRSGY
jgi:hypothetical protein